MDPPTPMEPLRLMAVLAHPDDESFAVGGALARYAAEGVAVHLVTATRGERGRYFTGEHRPGDDEVGRIREEELREAAEALGIADVRFLDYRDGELDRAPVPEAVGRIVAHLRRVRPQVVVTFDPFGTYGHPDHVAVCQLTTAAVAAAAGASRPHPTTALDPLQPLKPVQKLYYAVMDRSRWETLAASIEGLADRMEEREREMVPWPSWAVTTRIDAGAHWKAAWRALRCHRSQLAGYPGLEELPDEKHRALWGTVSFYRALSLVDASEQTEEEGAATEGEAETATETDLFAGLR